MTAVQNLVAGSRDEAWAVIRGLVQECAEAKGDRELEALHLAQEWGIDLNEVITLFKDAKETAKRPKVVQRRPLLINHPNIIRRLVNEAKPKPEEPAKPEAGKPEPAPEPKADTAEKAALPAVIPLRRSLVDERVSKWDDALTTMNEEHAIIDNYGGKCVIASWEPSPTNLERRMLVFQGKDSFLLRYSNRPVAMEVPDGKGGYTTLRGSLGAWWLSHRLRRQHRGVIFRPGEPPVVSDCLNLWRGWGVVPLPGDWSLIRRHINQVIADGNAEFAEYVIRWIAWSIQNPGAQAEVALVLIGHKGAGKGTLIRVLQRIFGDHAFQVTSREEVIGKFNGHLQDCVLFIADEAYWGGDKRCVGRLQGMITEPTLPIERKGFDLVLCPNYLHVVMLAEPGWVIPAGRYERRYATISVSDAMRGKGEYFKALHHQIATGGAGAMMWDLLRMDLGEWHPREIPDSLLHGTALQQQQSLTLPQLEQWYKLLLQEGEIPNALINWDILKYPKKKSRPSTAYTHSLKQDAIDRFPRLRYELSDFVIRDFILDEGWPKGTKHHDNVNNGYTFFPLKESREEWDRRYGPEQWNNMSEWRDRLPHEGSDMAYRRLT